VKYATGATIQQEKNTAQIYFEEHLGLFAETTHQQSK
jgi:hypothetical protein